MKTSICIEMIYTEFPFLERIKIAAQQGFDAIEFWNWDNKDMPAIKEAAASADINIATFQSNRGGTLIHPDHRDNFIDGIKTSLEKAREMEVKALFILTDELGEDRSVRFQFPELSYEEKYQSVLNGLKNIAPYAERADVTLVLEPLNTYVDHPGYFLNGLEAGARIVREVNSPNVRLLFDIYHIQVMEGNLIESLKKNMDVIGHIHVADVPGRHEPGTGEINYQTIANVLRESGYSGYIGLEFEPTKDSCTAAAQALSIFKE
jgi:hydroxypyruvate isomerase